MEHSPYGIGTLWQQGDLVTKSIAIILLLMSIASWTVIVIHAWRIWRLRAATHAAAGFWHAHRFADGLALLQSCVPGNPFLHLAQEGEIAVAHHRQNKDDLHGQMNLAEWLSESLSSAIDECAERLQSGLAILATVGSTAPFVGLFGTVWGIYHALVGIGVSGQASIDKVAGPVGEALIMTAFGLAVAIPAVLAYNTLMRANKRLSGKLQRFARQLHAYFLTGAPLSGQQKEQ